MGVLTKPARPNKYRLMGGCGSSPIESREGRPKGKLTSFQIEQNRIRRESLPLNRLDH